MNKYEELFKDILDRTRNGQLQWKQLRKTANSDVIFNASNVWRQFSTEFDRHDQRFKALLVEKKAEDPEADFSYEKYVPELLVLQDDELVTTIDESIVSRSSLISLVNVVESKSDRAQNLFGSGL